MRAPLVLGDGPDSQVLVEILERAGEGAGFAVVDRSWPPRLREELTSRLLAHAPSAGRLVAFTSGSGGDPRGIHRTFRSWDASLDPLTALTGLTGDDVVGLPGPLASTLYLYGAWHAHALGARIVTCDQWSVRRAEVTAVHLVPALLPSLLEQQATGLLPRLRLVVCGGDRLGSALRDRCTAAGLRLVEYYGSAETSFVLADADGTGLAAFPGCRVQVRHGQLWAASPYVCEGYLGGSAGPMRRDSAGFVTVGDRALDSGGGRFQVLGRDGGYTTGGHTVHLADVEHTLSAIPGIEEAVVVVLPHERFGQVGVAVYRGSAVPEQLRAPVRVLPTPARPLHWLRLDRLPRTGAGKPDRRALDELVRERFG